MIEQNARHMNRELSSLDRKLNLMRVELEEIQMQMSTDLFYGQLITKEKDLLQQIEKWEGIHEQILRQKSRATWIQAGDSNSKFLHAQIKASQARNRIGSICNEQGIRLTEPKLVEKEFVQFFQKLLGTCADELSSLDINIVKLGPCLTKETTGDARTDYKGRYSSGS